MKINGNNDEIACENLWFPWNGTCKDSALEGTGKGAYPSPIRMHDLCRGWERVALLRGLAGWGTNTSTSAPTNTSTNTSIDTFIESDTFI